MEWEKLTLYWQSSIWQSESALKENAYAKGEGWVSSAHSYTMVEAEPGIPCCP